MPSHVYRRHTPLNDTRRYSSLPEMARRAALDRGRQILIALAVTGALCAAVWLLNLPAPGIVLCAGLTAITAWLGLPAGIAGVAGAMVYVMYFYSAGHDFVTYPPDGLRKVLTMLLCASANVVIVGTLKGRLQRTQRRLREANAALRADDRVLNEADATDPMTGVRSRWAIRRDYNRYVDRYVHVMMLDLDDYRHLNDTYGHAVGDYLLKKVGAALSEIFGPDACYRYGGDEFLVLCVELDRQTFPARVRRLRETLGDISLEDKRLPVRFSAGSVYGDCEQNDDLRLMMHQAGQNLREVKHRGGNDHIDTEYSRKLARSIQKQDTLDEL